MSDYATEYEQYCEKKRQALNEVAALRRYRYEHPRLHHLFFEVTSRCNAHCAHCGSRCESDYIENEITLEEVKGVLDEVARVYEPSDILLNITGGEPLLRADLFDMMAYANSLGYMWGMTTNGMLITEEIAEKMNATNMGSVSISLDGMEKTHDGLRATPGGFRRIIDAIRILKSVESIKVLQVTTVINKQNIDELDEMEILLEGLGIDDWRIVNVDPIGRANAQKDFLLDGEDFVKVFNKITAVNAKQGHMSATYGCSHFLGEQLEGELRPFYFRCVTGYEVASILSNGDIFVCPNVPRYKHLIQGNIRQDDFLDVWLNRYEPFRNGRRTACETCLQCSDWDWCAGDSFHTWNFVENKPNICLKYLLNKEIFPSDISHRPDWVERELLDMKNDNTMLTMNCN